MDYEKKEHLAMTRNGDSPAASIRIKAARKYAGLSQEQVGKKVGIKKAGVANTENGRSYPTRRMMTYFYREHRLDFNFLMYGEFSQLPQDVQDKIFPILQDVHNEAGLKSS